MATPMYVYVEIASRYIVDLNDDNVDMFFVDILPTLSKEQQMEISEELLKRDGKFAEV